MRREIELQELVGANDPSATLLSDSEDGLSIAMSSTAADFGVVRRVRIDPVNGFVHLGTLRYDVDNLEDILLRELFGGCSGNFKLRVTCSRCHLR